MRWVWLPAAWDVLRRGCSGLAIGPKAAALSSVVLAKGAAQLCALDGPKHWHICHQSSGCWFGDCPAPSPSLMAAVQPEPPDPHHPPWAAVCFGSLLMLSLDAQQSISPARILSPSTQLIGAGQPSCLRHVPGACLQQVWPALLFAKRRRLPAVPDSRARADNARAARTLAIAFPMTLPCPPHSSDATHAFAQGAGTPAVAAGADAVQAALGSAGGLLPGGLIDISVT